MRIPPQKGNIAIKSLKTGKTHLYKDGFTAKQTPIITKQPKPEPKKGCGCS